MVEELLGFTLNEQHFALPLSSIERVIRAQEITPVSNAPAAIEGVIDYYGEVIATFNLRTRFSLPQQKMGLNDRLIIAKTSKRKVALLVDLVEDVFVPLLEDINNTKTIHNGLQFMNIVRTNSGIVLIYDLENLLSNEEEIALQKIIEESSSTK
ncbi:MAG: chemotaxis protein CheW [Bacteroidales bacterium]|nr:chemotaxis protein CheW [Bacteroidales bacterium]